MATQCHVTPRTQASWRASRRCTAPYLVEAAEGTRRRSVLNLKNKTQACLNNDATVSMFECLLVTDGALCDDNEKCYTNQNFVSTITRVNESLNANIEHGKVQHMVTPSARLNTPDGDP